MRPAFLSEYIRRCAAHGELSRWTVRLVGVTGKDPVPIGTRAVGLVTRQAPKTSDQRPPDPDRHTIRRVLSPADESRDLTEDQRRRALKLTHDIARTRPRRDGEDPPLPTVPTGEPLRRERGVNQPLLLIYPLVHPTGSTCPDRSPLVGFAVSFPFSQHPTETEYIVNDIWRRQEIDDLDAEDLD